MIKDSAPLSALISQYEPLIGGEGFDNHWHMGRQVYKGGIDREVIKVISPKVARRVPEKNYFGESNIIELGGVFEEVGGDEQLVGGGEQKVGSSV